LGNYNGTPSKYTTILNGIRESVSDQTEILFSEGCPLKEKSTEGFNEAIKIAKDADIAILVLGISPRLEGEEGQATESDLGGDRLEIGLPGSQKDLLKTIQGIGKPIVLILTGGSAISFNFAKEHIRSILFSWYPGEEGGKAIAEVIFGTYNPAGRLPVTFYKSVDQLPDVRDYNMVGRTYRYFKGEPLYPFGYGLSYTDFKYSSMKISSHKVKIGETVKVSVDVENIGRMEGEEVVQLYISQSSKSFRVPIRELKGFKRIYLSKNEKKTVSFEINQNHYSIVNMDGERIVQPGEIMIFVGGLQPGFIENASEVLKGSFKIRN
jgi:beta-glucosidase